MPLKEIKEPPSGKGESKQKKEKATSSASAASDPAEPWKYLEDGSKVRQGRKLPFENQLKDLFDTIAGAVSMADSFSGQVIGNQSQELAYGYAKLAKEDARVKAFFDKAFTASAYSAVVVPTVLTVVPIAWHFGLVPAKFGVPLTMASGAIPITREQEQQMRAQHQQEQAEAQARATASHPNGEAPTGDSGD